MAEQKLNIIFSGDTSQLEKAIQSATNELTNFEKKIKGSLGVDAFGQVGQAVDSLKQKFSQLSTIDIKANPQQALTAINEILTDISKLKSDELLLKADNSQALSSIKEVESLVLGIKSNIKVGFDSSGIAAEINKIEKEILELEALKIDPDITSTQLKLFEQNIEQLKNRLVELRGLKVDIPIEPELKGFDTSRLKTLLAPLTEKVELGVTTKGAEAEIKALLQQVKNLKGQDILINLDGTQVIKTIDAIEKELLQLQSRLRTATDPREIARLTQSLQTLKSSLAGTNVNRFSGSMNKAQQATFAFSQVLREAPAFAFSFQTGILALSNNLPILADRLKEARAAGASFGSIAASIGKSLFSLPGILTIASTALLFLGDKLFQTGKAAKSAAEDIGTIGEVISDSTASVQGDIAKVNALAEAFRKSAGSFSEQKRIIADLQKTSEGYFGDLEAGKTTYEELTKAVNSYTEALVQEAIVKGLQDAISGLAKELGRAKIAYADATKTADNYRKATEEVNRKNATNVQGLTGQNQAVNLASNAYNKLQGNVLKAGQEVGRIQKTIRDFTGQLGIEVLKLSGFKPLEGFDDDVKDETDKIIARARAFVQQFGEVFEVPDLTESFTNTRDKILDAAKKLLDDISKLNLKIKLPVTIVTETDFLPEPTTTPVPKEQMDKLEKAYIEQLKEAVGKNVVSAPDVSIDVADFNSKIKDQLEDAIGQGNFKAALRSIDVDKGNLVLDQLSEGVIESAELINETLTPAFQGLFDAIIAGEDPLKAFFKSIMDSINQVIKRLIAAAVQAAILSAITGGASGGLGFGATFLKLLTGGNIAGGSPGFIGGGSIFNPGDLQLVSRVSGTDLQFVLTSGNGRIGRTG